MKKWIIGLTLILFLFVGCDVFDNWQEPSLAVSTEEIDYDLAGLYYKFTISNGGGGSLNWTIDTDDLWLNVFPMQGSGTANIEATVNRNYIKDSDLANFTGKIKIESNGGSAVINVRGSSLLGQEEKTNWAEYREEKELADDYLAYKDKSHLFFSHAGGTKMVLAVEDLDAFSKEQLYYLANNYFNYFARAQEFLGEYPLDEVRLVIREEPCEKYERGVLGWEECKQNIRLLELEKYIEMPLARTIVSNWWGDVIELSLAEEDMWLKEGFIEYIAMSIMNEPQKTYKNMIAEYKNKVVGENILGLQSSLFTGPANWSQQEVFPLAAAAFLYFVDSHLVENWNLAKVLKENILVAIKERDILIDTVLLEDFLLDFALEYDCDGDGQLDDFHSWWSRYLKEGFPVPLA